MQINLRTPAEPQPAKPHGRLRKLDRMKSFKFIFGLLLAGGAATAQQYNISTIAGIGQVQGYFGDGGPATGGQLTYPWRVAVDAKGNYYIADSLTSVVREVSGGTINTIVGCENPCTTPVVSGFAGDGGPAVQAQISDVYGLATDSKLNIFLADTGNGVVRKVTATGSITAPAGVISTFAGVAPASGTVTRGYSGDGGPATSAELSQPAGVAVDSSGNVYISDYGNYTVRKVDTTGKISTIAGTGVWGYSGDGGPANKAMLGAPTAIAIDPAGNIFISDLSNSNIREITTDGNIHTFVSNVSASAIAVDAADNLYFADPDSQTVRKILPDGTQYVIAGVPGSPGFSGDGGPGLIAQLNQPNGVALDGSGNVYVADSQNQVIRLLTPVTSSISVVNGASGNGVSIAPGEIITIFGPGGLGPSTPAVAQPESNGYYGTELAGTTVSFNGTNAPMIYTSPTQVSAIVPYSMPIGSAANVTVTYQGQTSTTNSAIPITGSLPGIFTANASGVGQAAAINQDGSYNSPTSPAPEASSRSTLPGRDKHRPRALTANRPRRLIPPRYCRLPSP
jgi:sugar lactone lactonase YvrE